MDQPHDLPSYLGFGVCIVGVLTLGYSLIYKWAHDTFWP